MMICTRLNTSRARGHGYGLRIVVSKICHALLAVQRMILIWYFDKTDMSVPTTYIRFRRIKMGLRRRTRKGKGICI
jgi:hypothetical protein